MITVNRELDVTRVSSAVVHAAPAGAAAQASIHRSHAQIVDSVRARDGFVVDDWFGDVNHRQSLYVVR